MSVSPYTNWLTKVSESDVVIAPLSSGGVVTVDMGGYVRLWETGLDTLQRSLMEWRNMIGTKDGRAVQVISQLCLGISNASWKSLCFWIPGCCITKMRGLGNE